MRRLITIAAVSCLFAAPLIARGVSDGSLKGSYVEARTAEVFTGGCIMNGEAATTGREALLAWKVDRGSFEGVPLNGLAVVAAVAGDTNLGVREIGGDVAHTKSAVFVDDRANPAQRAALVSMAQQLANGVVGTVVEITPTQIQFVDEGKAIRVEAQALKLTVMKELKHDPTCGGKQWYHPLSAVDTAAMGTTTENAFSGVALGTKWSDPNKRSSFFGTFSY
jgi:Protein of unknown function (DUF1326)